VNKHKHKILAVSFALVLIGILIIQAYWIRSVVETRNKQFDSAVFSSLQTTIRALEQEENVTIITRMGEDTIVKRTYHKPKLQKRVQVYSASKVVKNNTGSSSYSYAYSIKDDSADVRIVSKGKPNATAGVFLLSSDSMVNMELQTEEFMDTSSLEKKLSKIGVLIHKMAAGKNDSILSLPKGEEVERLLKNSLAQNNINTPFYLGMKVNDTDAYKTADADTSALFNSDYHAELFPNDVLNRKGSLYVSFPEKNSFVF